MKPIPTDNTERNEVEPQRMKLAPTTKARIVLSNAPEQKGYPSVTVHLAHSSCTPAQMTRQISECLRGNQSPHVAWSVELSYTEGGRDPEAIKEWGNVYTIHFQALATYKSIRQLTHNERQVLFLQSAKHLYDWWVNRKKLNQWGEQ